MQTNSKIARIYPKVSKWPQKLKAKKLKTKNLKKCQLSVCINKLKENHAPPPQKKNSHIWVKGAKNDPPK